jgi:single-stranded-DNA-specific exonuclease
MEIKNIKKAAERIKKAILNKERIILYGDADLDGVTATILLKEAIKNLAGQISAVYFPDREKDGYGITKEGLYFLKEMAPALLVTLDLGITNFREISLAKKIGFEVVIIDHHEIIDKLPKAKIIVDPKQKGDRSSLEYLANVGIVYKLSEVLFENKMSLELKQNFLELVALGTIADMMPREGENEIMIAEGLRSIENSWRPGIRVFFRERVFENSNLFQKVSKFISLLNVRDVENQLPASYRLLTASSFEEAKKILDILIEKSFERKRKIEEIREEIEMRTSKKEEPLIFEGDSSWELVLLGSVASTISQKHQKPAFLYKIGEKESQGTARTVKNFDLVKAMKRCAELLESFGGHASAAGFRIKNENLEKFKQCLLRNYEIFTKVRKQ